MADAWEAARSVLWYIYSNWRRPQLLEFTKPRKRRDPPSSGPSSSSLKRARTQSPSKSESAPASSSEHEIEVIADSSDVEVQELSENGELSILGELMTDEAPCPICGVKLEIAAIPGHIERGCPPPKAKAAPAKTTWKKLFSGAGGGKGKT